MSKLEDAARELLRYYDAKEQEAMEVFGDSFVRDEWPQLEALRATLAKHEAASPCKLSEDDIIAELQDARKEAAFYRRRYEVLQQQDLMLQRQYQEMQQILVDQLSRPRTITLTEPPRELSDEKDRALCESAKYQEEEKYFTYHAYMDTRPGRTLFNAGFERGWKAARATESKVREG